MGHTAAMLPHQRLREATSAAHAALEALPPLRDLLCDRLPLRRYAQLLRVHRAVYAELEPRLLAGTHAYQPRLPLLDADLAACNEPFAAAPPSSMVAAAACTSAALLGMHYVTEGSLLGGAVIVRALRRALPAHPHHFFAAGLGRPASWWKHFQARLDAQLSEPAALEQAAASALATFALFRLAFEQGHP